MSIPIDIANKLKNIGVVEVDDGVNVDPVFLLYLENLVKKEEPEIEDVAFIQTITTPKGKGWSYLYIDGERVKERYLFNPTVHNHFSKKKLTDSLWHGEVIPGMEEIKGQARNYRFSEPKRH